MPDIRPSRRALSESLQSKVKIIEQRHSLNFRLLAVNISSAVGGKGGRSFNLVILLPLIVGSLNIFASFRGWLCSNL